MQIFSINDIPKRFFPLMQHFKLRFSHFIQWRCKQNSRCLITIQPWEGWKIKTKKKEISIVAFVICLINEFFFSLRFAIFQSTKTSEMKKFQYLRIPPREKQIYASNWHYSKCLTIEMNANSHIFHRWKLKLSKFYELWKNAEGEH